MKVYVERKPQALTAADRLHPAARNPTGWRWSLVQWLTGGEIEVVPMLPLRPIEKHEHLVVKLGEEGAYNTVEVKMGKVNELTETTYEQLAPDTFVAIDIDTSKLRPEAAQQIVGTVVHVNGRQLTIELVDAQHSSIVDRSVIKRVYWAPVGYRA